LQVVALKKPTQHACNSLVNSGHKHVLSKKENSNYLKTKIQMWNDYSLGL